jgi:VCBS repeat-containing protein
MKHKKIIFQLFLSIIMCIYWSIIQIPAIADSPSGNFQVFTNDGNTFVKGFGDFSSAINDPSTQNGYIIKISADLDSDAIIVNKSIKLTSDGQYILKRGVGNTGDFITITSGNTLTLENIIIDGNKSVVPTSNGSAVFIDSSATCIMKNNTIIQNNKAPIGGGVYNNKGEFIMEEGTIDSNAADTGGGVYNYKGKFTLNNGIISKNTAIYGAGVFSDDNGAVNIGTTFTMNNGVIKNNIASINGGGIYNNYKSTFNFMNGSIISNEAGNGGAVYNNDIINIYGGLISGNQSIWAPIEIKNVFNNGTKKYNVIFDSSGGVYSGDSQDFNQLVVSNYLVKKPLGIISKSGYDLKGWFASTDGGVTLSTNQWDFDNGTVTEPMKLYAKWRKTLKYINFTPQTLDVFKDSGEIDLTNYLAVDSEIGQTLTWSQNVAPTNGTLTIIGATAPSGTNILPGGTIKYKPSPGYVGNDSFDIQVFDGIDTAVMRLKVNIKDVPVLNVNVTFDTQGGSYAGNPLDLNQTIVQGNLVTTPASVITKSNCSFEGWFTSTDGGATLSASPWDFDNNTVIANTILYAKWLTNLDSIVITSNGNLNQVTGNLSSVDFTAILNNGAETAVFEWYVDGVLQSGVTGKNFTYNPTALGSYEIKAKAKGVTSSPITVNINANTSGQNMIPKVPNYNVITACDKPISGNVIATDANNDILVYIIENNPSHGVVSVSPDGTWTYTPAKGYLGHDSFTVIVSDGKGGSAVSTVNIIVGTVLSGENNMPTVPNYNVTTKYEKKVSGTVIATDVDDDPLTYSKENNPSHGFVVVNPDGTWTYTPEKGYSGNDSFTVTVSDGKGGSAVSTVNIIVGTKKNSDDNDSPPITNYIDNIQAIYEQLGDNGSTSNGKYTATEVDESGIIVRKAGSLSVNEANVIKTGNSSNVKASSLYGMNSAILAIDDYSNITINNSSINTNSKGANAIFTNGKNAVINLNNTEINTWEDFSSGLNAISEGTINGRNLIINTKGKCSTAVQAKNRFGTVNITKSEITTTGMDSSGIYSSGIVSVEDSNIDTKKSDCIVIDGESIVSLNNTDIIGGKEQVVRLQGNKSNNPMVGQSLFNMTNGSLTGFTDTLICGNNTNAIINLTNVNIVNAPKILFKMTSDEIVGNRNYGRIVLRNQSISGEVISDSISSCSILLEQGSIWTGTANTEKISKEMSVKLDSSSKWNVTGDSYLEILIDYDLSMSNINSNGFNIYYNQFASENAWINGKTITLNGGGKLIPIKE